MILKDKFTDSYFVRDSGFKPCPHPVHWGRDRKVNLGCHYEYGNAEYYLAVVNGCLEWRNVRVFEITIAEYRYYMAKLYTRKTNGEYFADLGDARPKLKSHMSPIPGCFVDTYDY